MVDHGLGLMSLYGHLSDIAVKVGQTVQKGEALGRSGETGLAGGDHLHFALLVRGVYTSPIEWWDDHWLKDRIAKPLVDAGITLPGITDGVSAGRHGLGARRAAAPEAPGAARAALAADQARAPSPGSRGAPLQDHGDDGAADGQQEEEDGHQARAARQPLGRATERRASPRWRRTP